MNYTLWSRGRLLGETDLGFIYRKEHFRCGWLRPTPLGERLLPMACGVAPALRITYMLGDDANALADVREAEMHEASLELELRDADNVTVSTDIAIIDTHYLLSLPIEDLDDEIDAELDDFPESWSPDRTDEEFFEAALSRGDDHDEGEELPRYQIHARGTQLPQDE